jgi:AcrR family transcriptional regulator
MRARLLTEALSDDEHSVRKLRKEEQTPRSCSFPNNAATIVRFCMPEDKTDKRVTRTRQALQAALLELMVERGYERLTVQQILDRAGVGRATFYLHFRGKEDLLRGSLDLLRDHLGESWHGAPAARGAKPGPLGFSLAFFQHVDSHRKLYRAVVGRESGVIVDRQMRRFLAELVREDLLSEDRRARPGVERPAVEIDLAAQYVTGALMAIVVWWLDRSIKLSAEEIDRIFRHMTIPALEAIRSPREARRVEPIPRSSGTPRTYVTEA